MESGENFAILHNQFINNAIPYFIQTEKKRKIRKSTKHVSVSPENIYKNKNKKTEEIISIAKTSDSVDGPKN